MAAKRDTEGTAGERLLGLRLEHRLSLKQASEIISERGGRVSEAQLSRLEHDRCTPRPQTMRDIADLYGVHHLTIWRDPRVWVEIK
jgi:transcriptional regulator with XRE-family HTH domain